jgi:hypothetical protein
LGRNFPVAVVRSSHLICWSFSFVRWHANADQEKNLRKLMRWLGAFATLFGLTTRRQRRSRDGSASETRRSMIGFFVEPDQRNLSASLPFSIPYRERVDPASPQNGYEYREYKNWRGIPKPRRCPFCKQAKGDVRRSRGGFLGVCAKCDARGPKRESYDEALRAWNGKLKVGSVTR